jgi:hypothetical protein
MKRTMLVAFGVIAMAILSQSNSFACHCSLPKPKSLKREVEKARKESRSVFSGRVLEISHDPQNFYRTVKFKVEKSWKGTLPEETTVVTGLGGGDCGYRFEVGEKYLVYAYGSNENKLETNICQRTAKLSDATEDVKILGRGQGTRKDK